MIVKIKKLIDAYLAKLMKSQKYLLTKIFTYTVYCGSCHAPVSIYDNLKGFLATVFTKNRSNDQ